MVSKKAEAGIGSLILFIALVLVAAVAAGVLIQTNGNLQSKALATASQSQTQVSSRLAIVTAWGENASATSTITDLYFKVKLVPGSDAIILAKTDVDVLVNNAQRQNYEFNSTGSCIPSVLSNASFASSFMASGQLGYSKPGYILDGDIVNLCLHLPTALDGNQQLALTITPTGGMSTQLRVYAPDVLTEEKVQLYP